jgi:hypothetical protein
MVVLDTECRSPNGLGLRIATSCAPDNLALEARVGIEPTHRGFADLGLTTWLPRLTTYSTVTYIRL